MIDEKIQRISELERKIAHQEKTIDELSEQVAEQWKTMDKLSNKLSALTDRFLALEEVATPTTENAKPPHW